MKTMKVITAVLLGGALLTACNNPAIQSTTTHVKDLVESDVFEVLPQHSLEVLVYNNVKEIEGEYLTLASVDIKEISNDWSEETLLDNLKMETKEMGGNGILILKKTSLEEGEMITKEWTAIAVYALDRIPLSDQYVSL